MSLSEGDKAIIRDIAREINIEVLKLHIKSCPHGKSLLASKMFLAGLCVGSGFAGGGLAVALAKFLMG